MANKWLLLSALLLLVPPHFGAVFYFVKAPRVLRVVYLIGPLTSVWNHGSTSAAAQWTDRAAMSVGCAIDCCCFRMPLHPGAAVGLYLVAKHFASTPLHALAHACVSLVHVLALAANFE
jgi:hypothetical protein